MCKVTSRPQDSGISLSRTFKEDAIHAKGHRLPLVSDVLQYPLLLAHGIGGEGFLDSSGQLGTQISDSHHSQSP